MRSLRPHLLALPFALASVAPRTAGAGLTVGDLGLVTVHCTTNAALTVNAQGSDLTITDDGKNVTFEIPVASLKTGNATRDKHMRGYLEADKYPKISLTVVRSELKFPDDGKGVNGSVGSTVTLHGIKKFEKVDYSVTRAGNVYSIYVKSLIIKLSDYKIEQPSFMGVKVNDSVSVEVAIKAKDSA